MHIIEVGKELGSSHKSKRTSVRRGDSGAQGRDGEGEEGEDGLGVHFLVRVVGWWRWVGFWRGWWGGGFFREGGSGV